MRENNKDGIKDDAALAILGAGSYGTALAIALSRTGSRVVLWGHKLDHQNELKRDRSNQRFLPDIPFPPSLMIETDLETAVKSAKDLLVVVPSHAFGEVLTKAKPFLRDDSRICWATKGLESHTGRLLKEVAEEVLGTDIPLAAISGPTFARELALGMPTVISGVATDPDYLQEIQDFVHTSNNFQVYRNQDFTGLQIGGSVKNVIAIGAGMSDGLGFGVNARSALITRGLIEMSRLGVAVGAKAETFTGMSGLGDLVLTCTDNQSRNRRFGIALGQGKSVEEALAEIGQVVEGYHNAEDVWQLAQRHQVKMTIVDQIYQVLYQGKNIQVATQELLDETQLKE